MTAQIQQAIQGNSNVQVAMGNVHLRSTPWAGLSRPALLTAEFEEIEKLRYWTRRKWVNSGSLALAVALLFFAAVTVRFLVSLMQLPQFGLAGLQQVGSAQTLLLSTGSVLSLVFTQAWWDRHRRVAKAEISAAHRNLRYIQHELRLLDLAGR